MNLIEKLGGYAQAIKMSKEWESSIDGDIPLDTMMYSYDFGIFSWGDLQSALLKYRRQHNIYEVGDKVVSKYENLNLFGDVVLEIEYFRKLSSVVWVRFTNENDYRVDALRHATDAEIAAGKRL